MASSVDGRGSRARCDNGRDARPAIATTAAPVSDARLYLVCDLRPGGRALADVLGAGARRRRRHRPAARQAGRPTTSCSRPPRSRAACATTAGALLILNDRPELVAAAGADGCHVGQDDMDVAAARALAGADALVGRSTHFPDEIDGATDADYIGVGPVLRDADEARPPRRRRRARALRGRPRAGAVLRDRRHRRRQRRRRRRRRRAADRRRARDRRGRRSAAPPRRSCAPRSQRSRRWAPVAASASAPARARPRAGRRATAPPPAATRPAAPTPADPMAARLRPRPRARRGDPREPRAAGARRAPARRHDRGDRRLRLRDRQRRRRADRQRHLVGDRATRRRSRRVTTALLLVAGVGMLARQYWAVLGFQTILGLQIVFFSLVPDRRAEVVARDHPARRDRPARLAVLEARPRDGAAADARAPSRQGSAHELARR